MQEENTPVANSVRTERTIAALKGAALQLFQEHGFAATSTQQIVKQAAVTRGALYHHYEDKRDLFETIIGDELRDVAEAIREEGGRSNSAIASLKKGGRAFVDEFSKNGRTKLILIEAPSVLGRDKLIELEDRTTRRTLVNGLRMAMDSGEIRPLPLDALVELFSAAFDAAALHIDAGLNRDEMITTLDALIDGLKV